MIGFSDRIVTSCGFDKKFFQNDFFCVLLIFCNVYIRKADKRLYKKFLSFTSQTLKVKRRQPKLPPIILNLHYHQVYYCHLPAEAKCCIKHLHVEDRSVARLLCGDCFLLFHSTYRFLLF